MRRRPRPAEEEEGPPVAAGAGGRPAELSDQEKQQLVDLVCAERGKAVENNGSKAGRLPDSERR